MVRTWIVRSSGREGYLLAHYIHVIPTNELMKAVLEHHAIVLAKHWTLSHLVNPYIDMNLFVFLDLQTPKRPCCEMKVCHCQLVPCAPWCGPLKHLAMQ